MAAQQLAGPELESKSGQGGGDLQGLHGGSESFCLDGQHEFPGSHAVEFEDAGCIGPLRPFPLTEAHLAEFSPLDWIAIPVLHCACDGEAGLHDDGRVICFCRLGTDAGGRLGVLWMSDGQGDLVEVCRDHVARPVPFGIGVRCGVGPELDVLLQGLVVARTVELDLCPGDR